MRIILSALLLAACGTTGNMAEPVVNSDTPPPAESSTATIDPLLLEAIQVWKENCRTYSRYDCAALLLRVDTIKVGKLEQGTLGTCKLWETAFIITRREITIAPDVVRKPMLLRAVLAHELGHCALLLNHVTSDNSHLMSPYLSTDTRVLEALLPTMLQRFYAEAQDKLIPTIE